MRDYNKFSWLRVVLVVGGVLLHMACGSEARQNHSSEVSGIGACVRGHLTEQCLNQRICKLICTAAGTAASTASNGGLGATVGIRIGDQLCSEVCEMIPKCSRVYVCDQYERGGP